MMNPTSYQLLNHLPLRNVFPHHQGPTSALPTTPRGHRSLRRVSLAPKPCRCLSSRLLAHRSGLRTNITRSEAAKSLPSGTRGNTLPPKKLTLEHGKKDTGGRRDFIRKPSILRLYSQFSGGVDRVMGDDPYGFFWSWVCAKRTWREVGK